MINRQNWLDVRAYVHYIERVRQNAPESVDRNRRHLRHVLEWADETLLARARSLDPTLPAYLLTARADGQDIPLAPASISKCLSVARQFFGWARLEWPRRYRTISPSWIELLQPPRGARLESRLQVHQFYTLEDVQKIATVSVETLRQERAQVAVCMLFLSGMRADALASLPISCVDLAAGQIMQLPSAGVRTKNRKAAITYLLDLPELRVVVDRWDRRVRGMAPGALWYATLTRDGMSLTETTQAFVGRTTAIERDVRIICALAGVPYLSPHKLRHGHVVYALKNARNMAELKAISQNVMHASVTITDQVYGALVGDDVKDILSGLGKSAPDRTISQQLEEVLALLRAGVE
jgi:integrase